MKRKTNPPEVNNKLCNGCGLCIEQCPSFVLEMKAKKAFIERGEWCIECGHCAAVCPTGAMLYNGKALPFHPKKGKTPAVSPGALNLLLRERRSVRNYSSKPVSEKALQNILDAGRCAPTGTNSRNVKYIIIANPEHISGLQKMVLDFYSKIFSKARSRIGRLFLMAIVGRRITEYICDSLPKMEYANKRIEEGKDPLFYNAPAILIAHAESWDTCSAFNCSVAMYNCSLMAHAMGIGCCFNGFLVAAANKSDEIRKRLGIPDNHQCFSAMTLGYSNLKYVRLIDRKPDESDLRIV
ncbi:MAG: nitroreductase family protein [Spirochaetota bacterium]